MIRNNLFWSHYINTVFLPEIEAFARCLAERLLPAFSNLSEEAERIANEEYDRLGSLPSMGDDDMADVAEKAEEKATSFLFTMSKISQGIINLFTSGLYHLFEQQLLFFHRKELLSLKNENDQTLLNIKKAMEILNEHEINITNFNSWEKIHELQLVNNTVKHAEGRSAEQLKTLRPDLFRHPESIALGLSLSYSPRSVYQPLAGEDVYVTVVEFESYTDAVKKFWIELSKSLETIKLG
jgi:hypothetical protein